MLLICNKILLVEHMSYLHPQNVGSIILIDRSLTQVSKRALPGGSGEKRRRHAVELILLSEAFSYARQATHLRFQSMKLFLSIIFVNFTLKK